MVAKFISVKQDDNEKNPLKKLANFFSDLATKPINLAILLFLTIGLLLSFTTSKERQVIEQQASGLTPSIAPSPISSSSAVFEPYEE